MLALATDYRGSGRSTAEIKATLADISRAGFTHVHWGFEWEGDYTYSIYEMMQIRDWLKEYGLRAKGVHGSEGHSRQNTPEKYHYRWAAQDRRDYTSENEYNRLAGVELICNRVDLAAMLGAEELVLHMQLPYRSFEESPAFRERFFRQVCKSLDELQFYCKARGVRLCVENLLGTPNQHQTEQFDLLFARYDRGFLGFCFDTGHGLVTNTQAPLELALRYRERLFAVHLSDNMGLADAACWEDGRAMTKCDLHRLPFAGRFDWAGFAGLLARSPYEQPVVLEVQQRDMAQSVGDYLADCKAAGERFLRLMEGSTS